MHLCAGWTGVNSSIVNVAGVVTTLAGSGSSSYANGIGTSAMFGSITNLAIDSSSEIYFYDSGHFIISKLSFTGLFPLSSVTSFY